MEREYNGSYRERLQFIHVPIFQEYWQLSHTARNVLAALCAFVDWDTGTCFPSQNSLGDIVDYDPKTIQRGLKELEKAGLVWKKCERGKNGIPQRTNYTLNLGKITRGGGQIVHRGRTKFPNNSTSNNTMNNRGNNRESAPPNFHGGAPQKRPPVPGRRLL